MRAMEERLKELGKGHPKTQDSVAKLVSVIETIQDGMRQLVSEWVEKIEEIGWRRRVNCKSLGCSSRLS